MKIDLDYLAVQEFKNFFVIILKTQSDKVFGEYM